MATRRPSSFEQQDSDYGTFSQARLNMSFAESVANLLLFCFVNAPSINFTSTTACKEYFGILNHSAVTHECDGQMDGRSDSKCRSQLRCEANKPTCQHVYRAYVIVRSIITVVYFR